MEKIKETRQRLASLEHDDARKSRLATEADVRAGKKTCQRTEGAAGADQAKHIGGSSSAQVESAPTSSTSFGMKAEHPTLPRIGDVMVDKGTAAPKPCLSSVEMLTLTAAGDLLPADKASTATRIIFYQLPLRLCPTEGTNSRTSNQYALHYSSFWKMEVLDTKSRQTLVFDPGGSTGRLRSCSFLGP